MREVLRPGDVAVDAGAYKGGYTFWMRQAVGPTGFVYAFEPQPGLATRLTKTVEAYGWSNVTVRASALGASRGERTLHVPGEGHSPRASLVVERPGARPESIVEETLDEALHSMPAGARLSFLKCDVEGHELEVLRGAGETLAEYRPALLVEHEARFCPPGEAGHVFEHLASIGYHGSFFMNGARHPLEDFDFAAHQVEGQRPYVNNFIFQATE